MSDSAGKVDFQNLHGGYDFADALNPAADPLQQMSTSQVLKKQN